MSRVTPSVTKTTLTPHVLKLSLLPHLSKLTDFYSVKICLFCASFIELHLEHIGDTTKGGCYCLSSSACFKWQFEAPLAL